MISGHHYNDANIESEFEMKCHSKILGHGSSVLSFEGRCYLSIQIQIIYLEVHLKVKVKISTFI